MIRSSVRPCLIGLLCCSAALTLGARAPVGPGPAGWVDDLSPIAASDWSYDRAAHLIERAGFGATPDDIQRLASLTPQQAVNELVDYERLDNRGLAPFDESGIWDRGMDPFPPSRAEAVRLARERGEGLGEKVLPVGTQRRLQPVVDKFFYSLTANQIETQRLGLWWTNRMLATRRPLEEKLTLFWHGHFATGENKVRDYRMMLQQNLMFRAHASGRLQELLIGILKDPAMLVYLDNGENIKTHPNENFGRELLELFTMGVGHYSEHDVREAARSFTGWTNDVLTYKFDAARHDFGRKTFLGRTGPFNGDDIIRIILEQPVTGEFVAGKLYRYFVRDEVADVVKTRLGRELTDSGYQIKPLMKRIFLSKDFYSPPSYATQIKSPVHLLVSTYRKMGLREVPTIPDSGRMTAGLGQALFDPPNVAGWAGGRTWITPSTLLQRGNMFRDVLFPDTRGFRPPDRAMSATDARVGERLARGMNITEATREGDAESNQMVDRDEDYNTRYGGYAGYLLAFKRTKLIPRRTIEVDLTAMVRAAEANTADKVVDHFVHRFLRVPLADKDRAALVDFLRGKLGTPRIEPGERLESSLRELLYLVLSTPEYQLG
ncbi:MAG TPA: DUF1800 domain-containing protein [Vicinamibacterales bacterium]|nr:DUF1800 domain-containing protein [Vicinamibacterales bacterium]